MDNILDIFIQECVYLLTWCTRLEPAISDELGPGESKREERERGEGGRGGGRE